MPATTPRRPLTHQESSFLNIPGAFPRSFKDSTPDTSPEPSRTSTPLQAKGSVSDMLFEDYRRAEVFKLWSKASSTGRAKASSTARTTHPAKLKKVDSGVYVQAAEAIKNDRVLRAKFRARLQRQLQELDDASFYESMPRAAGSGLRREGSYRGLRPSLSAQARADRDEESRHWKERRAEAERLAEEKREEKRRNEAFRRAKEARLAREWEEKARRDAEEARIAKEKREERERRDAEEKRRAADAFESARRQEAARQEAARRAADARKAERVRREADAYEQAEQRRRAKEEQDRRAEEERQRRQAEEAANRAAEEAAARAAEEARVQEELFSGEDWERQERRRLFNEYESKWSMLKSRNIGPGLTGEILPWPIFAGVETLRCMEHLSAQAIAEFLLHPERPGCEGKSAHSRIRAELLRWHPDKFKYYTLPLLPECQHEKVAAAVELVAKHLSLIMEHY
ncbi:hypothetical protein K488DRAFT_67100 [Vararia minispora EC-137]|uniref:Uncharacterized protein n=1 Tax=Vararia minispora EC-137 TaxID=1314806 RepID=A0ACB8R088_9AGAM|nr:hypothetical protein K488DRAFT_67100 [Vararia minispora EC-137]